MLLPLSRGHLRSSQKRLRCFLSGLLQKCAASGSCPDPGRWISCIVGQRVSLGLLGIHARRLALLSSGCGIPPATRSSVFSQCDCRWEAEGSSLLLKKLDVMGSTSAHLSLTSAYHVVILAEREAEKFSCWLDDRRPSASMTGGKMGTV